MDVKLTNGTRLHLIGDPHLGKKFETGVPLRYRGLREASQFQDFRNRLETDADIIVMVGDLFDHPYVGYSVVDEAAAAIGGAAERNHDTVYIMMAGNHDLPRNTTAVGAFHDLEQRLQGRYDNLHIVRRPTVINQIAILPWEWDRKADEQVKEIENEDAIAAVGHWDLATFEGRDDHLAPVDRLYGAFGKIALFSGHYHVAGQYGDVACTGSLQPYSHAEDTSGTLYVTMPLSDALAKPEGYFKGKMLRVLLKPGEDLPDIDALAVTHKRVVDETQPKTIDTVSLSDFDWNKMLAERINKLDPKVQEFIKERLPYDDTTSQQRRGSNQTVRQGTPDGDTRQD
jgi:hypothetical protein